ncbi:MAG: TonB-dependent receptor, partial [Verrucomicrobia bacterium]|nr:TonB-dependent receptor [Verrucomicrobiota bacterium]
WDRENLQQQEALGILGVNLIHAALGAHWCPETIISALLDNLSIQRIEVDMIRFHGPQFPRVDNRLLALQLVEQGLTNAAMFMPTGELVQPADALYKKPILVERGSFRPVTKVTEAMIRDAQAQFIQHPKVNGDPPLVLLEMTLKNLNIEGKIDHQDFLDRVDLLGTLGHPVLSSNYGEFYRLAGYLFRFTRMPVGIVMGVPTLRELFEEKYYADLDGGILESFGRMFKNDLKLYVYPLRDARSGSIITAVNLRVAPHIQHLYDFLLENQHIEPIRDVNQAELGIFSREVLREIQENRPGWEAKVPPQVADMIKERRLLGLPGDRIPAPLRPEATAASPG